MSNFEKKNDELYSPSSDSSKESKNEKDSDIENPEVLEEWPKFISPTFHFATMSIANKLNLFKLVCRYWVYCNITDINSLPKAVGNNKEAIKQILYYIFIGWYRKDDLLAKSDWLVKFKKNITLVHFYNEFFKYVNDTINVFDTDAILVRNAFATGKNKDSTNDLYFKVLNMWIEKNYSNFVKEDIISIFKELIPDLDKQKVSIHIKKFINFVAGCGEDVPNAIKMKKTPRWKWPNDFMVSCDTYDINVKIDGKNVLIPKDDVGVGSKRKRTQVEHFNQQVETKKSRKSKHDEDSEDAASVLSGFKYNEPFIVEYKDDTSEQIVEDEAPNLPVINSHKKFIESLPTKIVLILVKNGALSLEMDFIKTIKLSSEDEKIIGSTEILTKLAKCGIITYDDSSSFIKGLSTEVVLMLVKKGAIDFDMKIIKKVVLTTEEEKLVNSSENLIKLAQYGIIYFI
jgi:hypothetical protein